MRYKKIYSDDNFKISVFTNSKVILGLIDNFLDFRGKNPSSPEIKVSYYLEEISSDKKDKRTEVMYQDRLDSNDNLISTFWNKTTTITVDPRRAVVNAAIFNYQDHFKENILDSILSWPLRFIMAYRGFFFLHASAIAKGKNCIIINGAQNNGKSIIALTLAQNGFNFLTDDDCYVKSNGKRNVLLPFSTKIGLNNRALSRNSALKKYVLKNYRYGGKQRLSARDIFRLDRPRQNYNCRLILFPHYRHEGKVSLKPVSLGNAVNRLFQENAYLYLVKKYKDIDILESNLKILCNFVKKAQAFELTYNDERLEDVPELVEKALKCI